MHVPSFRMCDDEQVMHVDESTQSMHDDEQEEEVIGVIGYLPGENRMHVWNELMEQWMKGGDEYE